MTGQLFTRKPVPVLTGRRFGAEQTNKTFDRVASRRPASQKSSQCASVGNEPRQFSLRSGAK